LFETTVYEDIAKNHRQPASEKAAMAIGWRID
jgi:hypothetical protein